LAPHNILITIKIITLNYSQIMNYIILSRGRPARFFLFPSIVPVITLKSPIIGYLDPNSILLPLG